MWLWHKNGDQWSVDEVITIPAEPADADDLPPLFKPFGAAPPLVTDIDLSVDDRWLYVSCWGTGELKQYDVSDPFPPRETASVRFGGMVRREPHPAAPDLPLSGGPQMVEISRDGRRVYVTNSLYSAWDDAVYPDGVGAWMAKLDADVSAGGLVPMSDSSRTTTTSVACGCTKPGSRVATRRATRTASPAERPPAEVGARGNRCLSCLRCSGRIRSVDVEVRYVEGCPNLTVTRQRLALALAAVGRHRCPASTDWNCRGGPGTRVRRIADRAGRWDRSVRDNSLGRGLVVSALPRRRGHVRIGRCRAVDRCLGSAAWRCVGPIAMAADSSTIDRAEIAADLERARVEFHR